MFVVKRAHGVTNRCGGRCLLIAGNTRVENKNDVGIHGIYLGKFVAAVLVLNGDVACVEIAGIFPYAKIRQKRHNRTCVAEKHVNNGRVNAISIF